jgi:hypothetical protein
MVVAGPKKATGLALESVEVEAEVMVIVEEDYTVVSTLSRFFSFSVVVSKYPSNSLEKARDSTPYPDQAVCGCLDHMDMDWGFGYVARLFGLEAWRCLGHGHI